MKNLIIIIFVIACIYIILRKFTYMRNARQVLDHRKNLVKTLHAAVRSLDRLNAQWWLEGGSLLGAIRNGRIIPHDDDCDVSVVGLEQHLDALKVLLEAEGCTLEREEAIGIYKVCCGGQFTDLFPRYYDETTRRYRTTAAAEQIWPNEIYTLDEVGATRVVMFEGVPCKVPERAEDIIKNIYGSDALVLACISHLHHDPVLNVMMPYCYPV